MRDIVEWQIGMEQAAAQFYRLAAVRFAHDPEMPAFLRELADQEDAHAELLRQATAEGQVEARAIPIRIDQATRQSIEEKAVLAQAALDGHLDLPGLFRVMLDIEFSEWNDLFLYIVAAMHGLDRNYQQAVAEIERHRSMIEAFLGRQPDGAAYLADYRRLRPVRTRKILAIDDEVTVRRLLQLVLGEYGEVITAGDGRQALELMAKSHFDLVICDMNMPQMDGMQFYLQAKDYDRSLAERILFFTATAHPVFEDFLRRENLPRLTKPATISALRKAVDERIERRKPALAVAEDGPAPFIRKRTSEQP